MAKDNFTRQKHSISTTVQRLQFRGDSVTQDNAIITQPVVLDHRPTLGFTVDI